MIQKPTDIKHTLHIEVDPNKASPFGLKGLPQEWIVKIIYLNCIITFINKYFN